MSDDSTTSQTSSTDLWAIKDWPLKSLNTAADAAYMDNLEKEVLLHLNMVRSNPSRYAKEFIEPAKQFYKDKMYKEPGTPDNFLGIETKEGVNALIESVQELQKANPISPLNPSKGLTLAAADHANDQSKTGKTGHNGSDNSLPDQRIKRHGRWLRSMGENIAYGPHSGREIVISLLIDDGVPDRGHRLNIMNEKFGVVGIKVEKHPLYGFVCVIDFAGDFTD